MEVDLQVPSPPLVTPVVQQTPPRLSTFEPTLDSNVFPLSDEETATLGLHLTHNGPVTSIVFLAPHETLCLLGTTCVILLDGSISLLGTTLLPSKEVHRVFAPSSAPLPVLRCAFASRREATSSPFFSVLPPRILHALREELDGASTMGALIAFQELKTGVEGLGTVCRSFEGIFRPSKFQKASLVATDGACGLGVPGLYVVSHKSRDISPFLLPTSWNEALEKSIISRPRPLSYPLLSASCGSSNPTYLVKGPRNAGKSTFARTLLNRLLNKYQWVAFLECDIGQSEFGVSGLVGLSVVDSEIFGPPFTHLMIPYAAHYVGSTTPRSAPNYYLQAVHSLVDKYRAELAGGYEDGGNEGVDDEEEEEEQGDMTPTTKIRDTVPLIVNTMGWVKGLGADLTRQIEKWVSPEFVYDFTVAGEDGTKGVASRRNGSQVPDPEGSLLGAFAGGSGLGNNGMGIIEHIGSVAGGGGEGSKVFILQPPLAFDDLEIAGPMKKFTASDHRTLSLLSWFYGVFPTPPAGETPLPRQLTVDHWSTHVPLLARAPYEVDVAEAVDQVVLIGAGYEDVVEDEIGRVMNGAVVGLVRVDRGAEGMDDPMTDGRGEGLTFVEAEEQEPLRGRRNALMCMYDPARPPPSPYTSTCVGIGFVRAVAPHLIDSSEDSPAPADTEMAQETRRATMQVLTPVPPPYLSSARALVKGELELPVWGMLDHRSWVGTARDLSTHSTAVVVDEEGKNAVPYLQWGSDLSGAIGGEKKKVRRNLMRRGQM